MNSDLENLSTTRVSTRSRNRAVQKAVDSNSELQRIIALLNVFREPNSFFVILLSLLLGGLSFWAARTRNIQYSASEFKHLSDSAVFALQRKLDLSAVSLRAVRSQMQQGKTLNYSDWSSVSQDVARFREQKGMGPLWYAQIVDPGKGEDYTNSMRSSARELPAEYKAFAIHPPIGQDKGLVITYLSPRQLDGDLLGLNLWSYEDWRKNISTSLAAGELAFLVKVSKDAAKEQLWYLSLARYANATAASQIPGEHREVIGVLSMAINPSAIIDQVLDAEPLGKAVQWELDEAATAEDSAAANNSRTQNRSSLENQYTLSLGDLDLHLHFYAPRNLGLGDSETKFPYFCLILGLALAASAGYGFVMLYSDNCQLEDGAESSQRLLVARDAQLKTLLEAHPLGIAVTSSSGRVLYTNSAFQGIGGHSYEEIQQKGWPLIFHEEVRTAHAKAWKETLDSGSVFAKIDRLKPKENEEVWGKVFGYPVKADTKIVGYLIVLEDVTERKVAEESLSQHISSLIEAKEVFLAHSKEKEQSKSRPRRSPKQDAGVRQLVGGNVHAAACAVLEVAKSLENPSISDTERGDLVQLVKKNGIDILKAINQLLAPKE